LIWTVWLVFWAGGGDWSETVYLILRGARSLAALLIRSKWSESRTQSLLMLLGAGSFRESSLYICTNSWTKGAFPSEPPSTMCPRKKCYLVLDIYQLAPKVMQSFLYRSLFLLLSLWLRELVDLTRWLIREKQSGFSVLWITNHANNPTLHNLSSTLALVLLFIVRIIVLY
jgi:hypothetical protein